MDDARVQQLNTKLQQFLDKTAPFKLYRWLALSALVLVYGTRVFFLKGFYIVTYALAIYNLNLVLGFISPSVDPELEGPVLPQRTDSEYRPFRRRLPEMKFWMLSTRSFITGLVVTLFPFLDLPVYAPILLVYFVFLFCFTMRRQIKHMLRYRYNPFDTGKKPQKGSGKGVEK